ncbi:ornithine cyclodeaminase family protein [Ciceribacter sp. L1K22]|uniref:ornithine cyclodeaminase family protein n=1 Tax=Ciceribacter sp. L1K22 TaxID=2820275 RepID=UPI001ABE389C|nr:ornithine cyclodeaminase family protein [Ciceribacter sp. L1K22]MBO3758324.1 ornithine cyclodeaminase family protein [Ciceribacter sp. L1K22]
MIVLNAAETAAALPWDSLIKALEAMFVAPSVMPVRHHHDIQVPGEPTATLLLMPAWLPGEYAGVKLVSVYPGNGSRGLPAVNGSYMLTSGSTGELLAVVDGGELTARRTAAASALASQYLARPDSETMMMIGTGRLSLNLMQAHASVHPLRRFLVWGRSEEKVEHTARMARSLGLDAERCPDIETGVRSADIVSCATLSEEPLVQGAWLQPGCHVDLVGAFKPSMRESDDEVIRRAKVYVDTRAGALSEAGDIVQAIKNGVINEASIIGELSELVAGRVPGRSERSDITLFKSVGAAIEDLAAAILAYESTSSLHGIKAT